jgi:HSP20 family protein
MGLLQWDPFDGFTRVQSPLSDPFDTAFAGTAASQTWVPPVDILESPDAYLIRAELPGMNREDFNLEIDQRSLVLSGERRLEKPAKNVEYRRVERLAGRFLRSFYLPDTVERDEIRATYRGGILEVHVPKSEKARTRQITVTVN